MSGGTSEPRLRFKTELHLTGSDPGHDASMAAPAMVNHEVVRMTPDTTPTDLRRYYNQFVEALGTPIDIAEDYATGGLPTGKRWSEIRYDVDIPDLVAFRYSRNAQPFHTDESYVSSPAGIMLFYCVNAAPAGGETNYVSGRVLVDQLGRHRPELLDRLRSTKVRYAKASDYKDRPIIEIDAEGRVDLNYNFYCADPDQDAAALELNQQFFDYLLDDLPAELVFAVGLRPGESVAWRDDCVLHGRNAFTANKTNDRLIWKTGVVLPT